MPLQRLKRSGKPEDLTVNGQAALAVQNAQAYQKLLDAADLAQSVQILRDRISAADKGAKGVPADQVLAQVRKRLGLPD